MNKERVIRIIRELIEENPLAVRAVLRIVSLQFTKSVDTLAVTLEERPRLKINLDWIKANCKTDEHVKAAILHEFLHVVLGHTDQFKSLTPMQNVALDAIINSIIHRQFGPEYSSLMSFVYKDSKGVMRLLRPPTQEEVDCKDPDWEFDPDVTKSLRLTRAARALYAGELISQDIFDLARDLAEQNGEQAIDGILIGSHSCSSKVLPEKLRKALCDEIGNAGLPMGKGFEKSVGSGTDPYKIEVQSTETPRESWRRQTKRIFEECLAPDRRSRRVENRSVECFLPVLNERDRRGFLTSIWSPLVPNIVWEMPKNTQQGSIVVYLDVRWLMTDEIIEIVSLLNHFQHYIKQPMWLYDGYVKKATITNGNLQTIEGGETWIDCMSEHIIATRPKSAVTITDGDFAVHTGPPIKFPSGTRVKAIITAHGNARRVEERGVKCHQLDWLPDK